MKFSVATIFSLAFAASSMMTDVSAASVRGSDDQQQQQHRALATAFSGKASTGPGDFQQDKGTYCDYQYYYSKKTENYREFETNVYPMDDGTYRVSTGYLKCCSKDEYMNSMFYASITCPGTLPAEGTQCASPTGSACSQYTESLAKCEYGDVKISCEDNVWTYN